MAGRDLISSSIRGASPLGLPHTVARSAFRRLAPLRWPARYARSLVRGGPPYTAASRFVKWLVVCADHMDLQLSAVLGAVFGLLAGACAFFISYHEYKSNWNFRGSPSNMALRSAAVAFAFF